MTDLTATPKSARDESFPVASLLLSPPVRRHVLAFYSFVRAADDIADSSAMPPPARLDRLAQMQASLSDPGTDERAQALVAAQLATGYGVAEARQLLQAFRQDVEKTRYSSWDDLCRYCDLSAVPVGRFLLGLHGESQSAFRASDALCAALQVLNHLQDCAADHARLDRVYIPEPWINEVGGDALFFQFGERARRRPIFDAMLDRVDALLLIATDLPRQIESRRLAIQAAATLALAKRMAARLRRRDPVEERVSLPRLAVTAALASALLRWRPSSDDKDVARQVAKFSSSFALGMKALRADRRAAIFAVYAFARGVDDIADAPMPIVERRALLAGERARLERVYAGDPEDAVERELVRAIGRFNLPKSEFDLLLAGMEADTAPVVTVADEEGLALYCRQVAGAIGQLSVRIFGLDGPDAERFALTLGEGFQIINVLRDIDEDAKARRLYLPATLLRRHGIAPDLALDAILRHPKLPLVCAGLAARARRRLIEAEDAAASLDPSKLRAARLMKQVYCRHLDQLEARGWENRSRKPLRPPRRLRLPLGTRTA